MGTSYCTRQDLEDFAINKAALASKSDPEVANAIAAASAHADSYIGTRFELPLKSYGVDIKMNVAKLAAKLLMMSRGFNPGTTDAEMFQRGWEEATKWLEQVSKGICVPQFPDTQDKDNFNPQNPRFIQQVAQGGPSLAPTFQGPDSEAPTVAPGVRNGRPRSRGW